MKFLASIIFGIVLAAAAYGQTVSGVLSRVERGRWADGVIVLDIPKGFHVNSNNPTSENLIPTTVRLTSSDVSVSQIDFPAGRNVKFEFSDQPLNVYEGRVRFRFRYRAPGRFRGKVIKVRAEVAFQPCTETVCYLPRTERITLRSRLK